MLTEIRLHGDLEDFGKEWSLNVHSPDEAVRAIDANSPGFLDHLRMGKYSLVALPLDEEVTSVDQADIITEDRYFLPISNKQVLHFIPVGEGNVETAIFVGTTILVDAGISVAVAYAIATVVVYAAITFALITVADMLMPTPPGMDKDESDPSYAFSGPINTARQGGAVPVLYGGPLLVGSQVIGHSIVTEDISHTDGDNRIRLKSAAYAEIVDAVSEGVIEGFAGTDLASSVYFDDTPAKIDGNDQFEGFDVVYRTGTASQSYVDLNLSSHPGANSIHNVNILLKEATGPLTKTTQDSNIGAIRITMYTPSLVRLKDNGHKREREVDFTIRIKGTGIPSYISLGNFTIKGITTDGYFRDYTFPLLDSYGDAPYNLLVERTTPDNTDTQIQDELYWATWTEIVTSNLAYPNTALVVTKLDAEKFSSIPTRGFLMNGIKVQIPSNYNPVTRVYTGNWDGNFSGTLQWTNNPAWVYFDLATSERYGLGQYLTEDLIDIWALYSIAVYCDQLVDDGYGGTEPRFRRSPYCGS